MKTLPDLQSSLWLNLTTSSAEFLSLGTPDILGWMTFLWGAVLCIAGGLTASLASTRLYPRCYQHSPIGIPENISRRCQVSPRTTEQWCSYSQLW